MAAVGAVASVAGTAVYVADHAIAQEQARLALPGYIPACAEPPLLSEISNRVFGFWNWVGVETGLIPPPPPCGICGMG